MPNAHARATRALAAYYEALWNGQQITPCSLPWPTSVEDVAPTRCELIDGHTGHHRYRFPGTSVVVEWQ